MSERNGQVDPGEHDGEREAGPFRVVLVDDSPVAREALRRILDAEPGLYEVAEASSATEAMRAIEARRPDVVLMDIGMPGTSGIEATAEIGDRYPQTRVVVYSGSMDPGDVRNALEAGASGYTVKSSDPAELRQAILAAAKGRGVLSSEIVRPVINHYVDLLERSRQSLRAVIESLAAAVEAKDPVTSSHLRRVSSLAVDLAARVDERLARSDEFVYGTILHDVGKIGVPERILRKPGPLTDAEWKIMRRHPVTGADVIEPLGLGSVTRDVVLHHHERWDGSGYPDGLREKEIPLPARIFSVCDAIDAMVSERPYRSAIDPARAVSEVEANAGSQFDPDVASVLTEAFADGSIDLLTAPADPDSPADAFTRQATGRRPSRDPAAPRS